jgi:hypothetical protein
MAMVGHDGTAVHLGAARAADATCACLHIAMLWQRLRRESSSVEALSPSVTVRVLG